MDNLRQIGIGILLAVISIFLVGGALVMALVEGKAVPLSPTATFSLDIPTGLPTLSVLVPTSTDTPISATATLPTDIPLLVPITYTPNPYPTSTPLFSFVLSPTPYYFPTVSTCSPPFGWIGIIVQQYDSLSSIALRYNMSTATLMQENCLVSDQLRVGMLLYVLPSGAVVTSIPPTVSACGAPYGWINYYVVSGDTLYNISLRYRVTVAQLQSANCMGASTFIQAGQTLKVPNVATTMPQVTSTSAPTATAHPTSVPPSATPAPTLAPTAIPTTGTGTPSSGAGPG